MRSRLLFALLVLLLPLLLPAAGSAAEPATLRAPLGPDPLAPASVADVELLDRALAKLATHRRLLVVGAHPDDEDTSALTLVSRELGGESAYLSLSRGEGGQNLIGPELGVELGLVRSRELLAARGVDGGRQYFTRAYDFGYTRSLEETFGEWPRQVLLEDAVRVIRRFRPQVVVSVFPGNPRAGHGQHQAAGVVAHEAFEKAGDPSVFPELPDGPWSPSSIFRATWWDRDSTTLTTDLGRLDPLDGRTIFQIAMESRSQHRSQDMGRVLPLGPYRGRYGWVAGPGGRESEDLFDGIDTRLEAIADLLPAGVDRREVSAELAEARELAETVRSRLAPRNLGAAVSALARIRGHLREAVRVVEEMAAGAGGGEGGSLRSQAAGTETGRFNSEAAGGETGRFNSEAAGGESGRFNSEVAGGEAGRFDPEGAGTETGEGGSLRSRAAGAETGRFNDRPAEAGRFDWESGGVEAGVVSARALLGEKLAVADAALAAAAGLGLDAWTERDAVAPGEGFRVEAALFHGALPAATRSPVEVLGLELARPGGDGVWRVEPTAAFEEDDGPDEGELDGAELAPGGLERGQIARWAFEVTAERGTPASRPYFLEGEDPNAVTAGERSLYDWSAADPAVRGEPFGPPPLVARFHLRLLGEESGEELTLEREVVQRVSDQAEGEVRRPLRVVPRLEVAVEPELVVWSTADGARGEDAGRVTVTLRSHVDGPLAGRVRLETPPGWPAPEPAAFEISRAYETAVVELALDPPGALERGHYSLGVAAEVDGDERAYRASFPLVDYPHIRPTPSPRPARVELAVAPIELPEFDPETGRVGYVLGASDRVPAALAAVGVPIETLDGEDLGERDLSGFDAIVVGSRAYETDAALGRHNGKLLDYARAGGLVIVLYQQYQFARGDYAPYALDIARPHDRVTDETAPVRLLEPEHPAFTSPNRIGPADWEGWVQERGLYFAHTWGAEFRPLLQFPSDPALAGAEEGSAARGLRGGLLVADLGEGTYVYTGLALFRQLPAGVTGAYRLFANLLGLGE